MIFNLNELETISGIKKYDVVICGGGVAGITIAKKLAGTDKQVLLLEAGDYSSSDKSSNLYSLKNIGLSYGGAEGCRLRYFGGTSNHWAGRCMRLQDYDFEERPYLDLPSWPIGKKELEPYFIEACGVLEISSDDFHRVGYGSYSSNWFENAELAKSPPTRFGKKYKRLLESAKNVDVFLNANVVDLILSNDRRRVKEVKAVNYDKKAFLFHADKAVLCMGAVENARFLLNTDHRVPGGIGNQTGMVGRCFMEHFNVRLGRYVANANIPELRTRLEWFPKKELLAEKQIGSSVIAFTPNSQPKVYGRLAELKRAARDYLCKSDVLLGGARDIVDFDCPGDGIIDTLCEQAPNVKSRIVLLDEEDSLGMRKAALDWQVTEKDILTIRSLGLSAAKEFARLDLGRIKLRDYILNPDNKISDWGVHCHHMGTTRMSDDPKFGVVNRDLRIHGFENLYIAGSSVFSTGGGVNPTFTIVQLSLRLAEHFAG